MIRLPRLGKRILSLILCLTAVAALSLPAVAAPTAEGASAVASGARGMASIVYSAASSGATPIGTFEDGTRITVKSQTQYYYKVNCYGMNGYIAKSQVEHTEDDEYIVRCQPDSIHTQWLDYMELADVLPMRHSLQRLTQKQVGSRYRYGGTTPGRFDCSGLVYYVYHKHDIALPHGSTSQLRYGVIVSKDSLQIGDLVFFRWAGAGSLTSHVGIYVGDNQFIHASTKGVRYDDLTEARYANSYVGARRILNTAPTQIEAVPTVTAETVSTMSLRSVDGAVGVLVPIG